MTTGREFAIRYWDTGGIHSALMIVNGDEWRAAGIGGKLEEYKARSQRLMESCVWYSTVPKL
jgi:hypothetical protein